MSDLTGQLKQIAAAMVRERRNEHVELSSQIHANPEIRFQEHQAAQWLCETLERHGFRVERPVAGLATAFVARRILGRGGPSVGILAEYDALEQVGHACGHNIIATSSVAAAVALKDVAQAQVEGLDGEIIVYGTPGEEGGGGKCYMADAGLFKECDVILQMHPTGTNGIYDGFDAREALEVTFTGRPAHAAATPEQGLNALDGAVIFYQSLALLRKQMRHDLRVFGIFAHGGEHPIIIPAEAKVQLFVVSQTSKYLFEEAVPAVEDCARGAALASRTQVSVRRYVPTYQDLVRVSALDDALAANMAALNRPLEDRGRGQHGSSDMGNVSYLAPSAGIYVKIGRRDLVHHAPEFTEASISEEGHQGMLDGGAALAMTAVDIMTRPELRAQIRKQWEEQIAVRR
ncbi:MAG: amidohydrolase [Armatimonadetes bacterium]|nr:amidohydrolase [Armatimonadota bacterium]